MKAQNAGKAPQAVIRWLRILWPVVFLIPLGFWAGRYCALSITDPVYHAILWAHERIWMIWAALALLSVGSALSGHLKVYQPWPVENVPARAV